MTTCDTIQTAASSATEIAAAPSTHGPIPVESLQHPLSVYQALLEAPDLKTRAEILVAITEIDLAKKNTEGDPQLQ